MAYRLKSLLLVCIVAATAIAYAHLMLVDAHFSPIDDHNLLVTTLAGKWLPLDIWPSLGRFDPLTGQELNLISLIANNLVGYYAFNAAELAAFCFAFYAFARETGGPVRALGALALILLLPGLPAAWMRLEVSERDTLTLFAIMFWAYWRYSRLQSATLLAMSMLAANLALYCKETSFVLIGTFACMRLLASSGDRGRETRRLDILLLGSAALYIAIYTVFVIPRWGPALYGAQSASPLLRVLKYFGDYATTDPILVFLVLPLVAVRAIAILWRRARPDPWIDPLVFAAAAYAGSYFLLDLHQPYYFLPAYSAALPGLLAWLRQTELSPAGGWRWPKALALFFLLAGALPTTMFQISSTKYVARNYDAMLTFLSADIDNRGVGNPVCITLEGVTRDSELYVSLRRFLVYRGVAPDRFEMLAMGAKYEAQENRPCGRSVAGAAAPTPDYLIVSPGPGIDASEAHLRTIERNYREVFRTTSEHAIPNVSIRVLLKDLIRSELPELGGAAGIDLRNSYGVDYYVFVPR